MSSILALAIAISVGGSAPMQEADPTPQLRIPAPAPSSQSPLGTGASFLNKCEPAMDGEGPGEVFGICLGFVEGVIARDAFGSHLLCVPSGVTRQDVMTSVFRELRSDEGLLAVTGRVAVLVALRNAYPAGEVPRDQCFGSNQPMF